jgi:hypothetical protein
MGKGRTAFAEVQSLIWLAENVIGGANKREASRWIAATVSALRFETELRSGPDSAAVKLAALAKLQRSVKRAGFVIEEAEPITRRIGIVGGVIEADARLVAAVGKAPAPVMHRLTLLLRLASGESAPTGPAADRAKAEAVKLMRAPQTRSELSEAPEGLEQVRTLLQTAGLAA